MLCHLGIIFYEKEEIQQQVIVKEFKAKFIHNLTHPVAKMLEYKGGYPEFTELHKCLLKHHLTDTAYDILKDLKTSNGFNLDYAIQSGAMLPHCKVGLVNEGLESLEMYKDLNNAIIEQHHSFKPDGEHTTNMNSSELKASTLDAKDLKK